MYDHLRRCGELEGHPSMEAIPLWPLSKMVANTSSSDRGQMMAMWSRLSRVKMVREHVEECAWMSAGEKREVTWVRTVFN